MDESSIPLLRDTIVRAFVDPEIFRDWVRAWLAIYVPEENVFNLVRAGVTFNVQVYDVLEWAEANGRMQELLQALADKPPSGSTSFARQVYVLSGGTVILPVSPLGGAPIPPCDDWFVTKRPFVNRKQLREALKSLDTADAGPDSVLVVDGPSKTGKSYGLRFAVKCAPQTRFFPVDVADWGDVPMNAEDLAKAIFPDTTDGFPPFDVTKEDDAVPRLHQWLTARLRGTQRWIIIDHCRRPNLTRAAESLLFKLAGTLAKQYLPGVRLIVADIDRTKLPESLPSLSRYDLTSLPNREAVEDWCRGVAKHLDKSPTDEQIRGYVDQVFEGFNGSIDPPTFALVLESRLARVLDGIRGTGG
jgi:hypothetical protein